MSPLILCGTEVWSDNWQYGVTEMFTKTYSVTGIPVTVTEGTNNSTSHTLGIAVVGTGGALSASGTQTVSWSTTMTQPNAIDANMGNRVNYRQSTIMCGSTYWKPYSFYDLLTVYSYAGHVDYINCSPHAKGASWTSSNATNATFAYGVALAGISLSAQSGYGTSAQLTYNFNVAGQMCGSLVAGPASSPLVSAHL